jgi:hypothetical protein
MKATTNRGKPCVKRVSYREQKNKTGGNALFGMWKDNDAVQNVDEYVRKLRNGRI